MHPSDLAPAPLVLDATVLLRGRDVERILRLAEFFHLPVAEWRTGTSVRSNELLLAVHLPPLPDGTLSTYLKAMDRKVWAFALVGVAAMVRVGGEAARLILSGVAPIPSRAVAAEEALLGAEVSEALCARGAEVALAEAQPLHQNASKVPLAKALIRRGLITLTEQAIAGG